MKLTVIGLGHAGIVASVGLAAAGHEVLGVDLDMHLIGAVRSGHPPIYEPGLDGELASVVKDGRLRFAHLDEVEENLGDAVLITTGTPSAADGAANLDQARSALAWVASRNAGDLLVVMKSTVPPGSGRRIVGELGGSGIRYASNPEFLREGRALDDWYAPDRIVVGVEPGDYRSVALVKAMYAGIDAPYLVTDITTAEMVKYASNALLATRISFINEIAQLCDRVGASIDDVSQGLALDTRTGTKIHAGVGYGGSCFTKDLRALDVIARAKGVPLDLLQSVMRVNQRQRLLPLHSLQERFHGTLAGLTIGVLGLAFKPGTDDVRDAPSLDLIGELVDEGARVRAYDPRAMEAARRLLPPSIELVASPLEAAEDAQALVLLTEWDEIVHTRWEAISRSMLAPRFVFDGRNALNARMLAELGMEYVGVGRNAAEFETGAPGHQRELILNV